MPKRIKMTRQRPWRADNPDAVIVARPSKWGNPYKVGEPTGWEDGNGPILTDANTAVILFESSGNGELLWWEAGDRYLTDDDIQAELGGHDLACWCPLDQPCHADVLLKLANPTPAVVVEGEPSQETTP